MATGRLKRLLLRERNEVKIHKFAQGFPLLEKAELDALATDIKQNGLKQPIVLYEDSILDGRNRFAACQLAGVQPNFTEYSGESPAGYVLSLNLNRRHLTPAQKAVAVLSLREALQTEAMARMNKGVSTETHPGVPAPQGRSDEQLAKIAGISPSTMQYIMTIADKAPEVLELIKSGSIDAKPAARVAKEPAEIRALAVERIERGEAPKAAVTAARAEVRKQAVEEVKAVSKLVVRMEQTDCVSFLKSFGVGEIDAIVSDPPYPKEFVHCYEDLARVAAERSIRLVAVMCGQSYLPEVYAGMSRHLTYLWTFAYLTPGQATQLWEREINTSWKPILVFGARGRWMQDVVTSDLNDKRFHHWGQSESGMLRLVDILTEPGALVVDPFIGAGTTGVACLELGRRFAGCDIDAVHVATAKERLI